ncbi:MAG: hypothetical protein M3Q03_08580 [Chloroflexota bacterium]|nr:hypothetical protein [Chloroflexota bacterium]
MNPATDLLAAGDHSHGHGVDQEPTLQQPYPLQPAHAVDGSQAPLPRWCLTPYHGERRLEFVPPDFWAVIG